MTHFSSVQNVENEHADLGRPDHWHCCRGCSNSIPCWNANDTCDEAPADLCPECERSEFASR